MPFSPLSLRTEWSLFKTKRGTCVTCVIGAIRLSHYSLGVEVSQLRVACRASGLCHSMASPVETHDMRHAAFMICISAGVLTSFCLPWNRETYQATPSRAMQRPPGQPSSGR